MRWIVSHERTSGRFYLCSSVFIRVERFLIDAGAQNGPSLNWIAKPHSSTPEAHSEKVHRAFT